MADVFDPQKRSEIMSMVRSKDTVPEIRVRKLFHSMGYRFRLQRNDLPGKPDIVLSCYFYSWVFLAWLSHMQTCANSAKV
ncbi:hypothetical protein ACFOQM_00040 [Paenibacillus sp. GCM10012307]|uniref:Very short patch repair endonuclease n=1 Tax=Paenibacillus roseus TaxID=2798579 RepID=A0A934J3E5_9BACL|nr:hypothetical protein [Paenibacillus roseus]